MMHSHQAETQIMKDHPKPVEVELLPADFIGPPCPRYIREKQKKLKKPVRALEA